MLTKIKARIAIAKAPTKAATPNKAFVVLSFVLVSAAPLSVGDGIGGVVDIVATVGDKVDAGSVSGAISSGMVGAELGVAVVGAAVGGGSNVPTESAAIIPSMFPKYNVLSLDETLSNSNERKVSKHYDDTSRWNEKLFTYLNSASTGSSHLSPMRSSHVKAQFAPPRRVSSC